MTESSLTPELPPTSNYNILDLNKDLESMIEDIENMSVQLTWMAYDLVTLRTSPELGASMLQLKEAYNRCRVAVYGDLKQKPEIDLSTETAAITFS
ncbi:synaptonemal complex central element protein 3 [Melanotaenia boesemani]|uniref:synaptonemal complex central element protein 3 n=1 Tax=Melanotaenia boesemani TaxID=1250792 RepID=UPI001C05CDCA|nr:synaptonemal complex central element protein 3 [Melanotaenia boesemani]